MENKITCIAVDDEPLALEIIESYIAQFTEIELVATYNSAIEASEHLNREKIDLMFMDIQMPGMTGLDFMKAFTGKTLVIFTTAYQEYAAEAFDLDAIDYLLKPISLDRFAKAVSRAQEYYKLKYGNETQKIELESAHMFVKSDSKILKVAYDEIQYVEAFADYVKIYINNEKRIVTLQTMKNMQNSLPKDKFIRVHRSFIISLSKIKSYNSTEVEIGSKKIPVGKNYKEDFLTLMKQLNAPTK